MKPHSTSVRQGAVPESQDKPVADKTLKLKTLVHLFLTLVILSACTVLYILLCLQLRWLSYRRLEEHKRPLVTVSGALSFEGYSRVPDGKPLVRAQCRQCALVSSSGQMLGSRLGKEIDRMECVLRMNQAPTNGYEEDVGTKSTVRVVSHTSIPLLLRNQSYFFKQSRETIYVVWGPMRMMSREKGGLTYRTLQEVKEMYPSLQIYTLTEKMMAYCDEVFQDETGKNRMKSGSFLSTGWFTMILAMELCEQIFVFGMVSDSYCRTIPECLTTTSKRTSWTSAGCTSPTRELPGVATASSLRKLSSPTGQREGTLSSITPRGRVGRGVRPMCSSSGETFHSVVR